MKVRFMSEMPIENAGADLLDHKRFVNVLASAIKQTNTPFVFGVLGDWGIGKTSILRILKDKIHDQRFEDNRYTYTVWLDLWKYEREENMLFPILYSLRTAMKAFDEQIEAHAEVSNSIKKILGAVTLSVMDLGVRFATKTAMGQALSIKDIAGHLQELEKNTDAVDVSLTKWADSIESVSIHYSQLVDEYRRLIAQQKQCALKDVTLIFLIDDLDRCLPEAALNVMESIKNHLSVPGVIYVLALNPEVVFQGIGHKFPGLQISGREYLEKIINFSFRVPEPSSDNVRAFSRRYLLSLFEGAENEEQLQASIDAFCETVSIAYFSNPRKIKRIANHYLNYIATYRDEKLDDRNMAKIFILAEYFPELYRLLKDSKDLAGHLKLVISTVSDSKATEELKQQTGFSIDPYLPSLIRSARLLEFSYIPHKNDSLEAHFRKAEAQI